MNSCHWSWIQVEGKKEKRTSWKEKHKNEISVKKQRKELKTTVSVAVGCKESKRKRFYSFSPFLFFSNTFTSGDRDRESEEDEEGSERETREPVIEGNTSLLDPFSWSSKQWLCLLKEHLRNWTYRGNKMQASEKKEGRRTSSSSTSLWREHVREFQHWMKQESGKRRRG